MIPAEDTIQELRKLLEEQKKLVEQAQKAAEEAQSSPADVYKPEEAPDRELQTVPAAKNDGSETAALPVEVHRVKIRRVRR